MTIYEGVGRIWEIQQGVAESMELVIAGNCYLPDLEGQRRVRSLQSRKRKSYRKGSFQESGPQPPVSGKEAVKEINILPSLSPPPSLLLESSIGPTQPEARGQGDLINVIHTGHALGAQGSMGNGGRWT